MIIVDNTQKFQDSNRLDAAWHFATEDYLLSKLSDFGQPILMLWQTSPTLMIGQYQIAQAEIDTKLAKDQQVSIVRRSSGGGTIFTDPGTLLITLIEQGEQKSIRQKFADLLTGALSEMGIDAKLQGRNDILVGGKKVSGMAQYLRKVDAQAGSLPGVVTHGSLLIDTDLDQLVSLLKVDNEKLRSKAIKSIRSRVTNIKKYAQDKNLPAAAFSVNDFVCALQKSLQETNAAKPLSLNELDYANIMSIYKEKYGNPQWIRKRSPKFRLHNSQRFAGGLLDVYLDVSAGEIKSIQLHGDFLGASPISGLEAQLTGQPYDYQALSKALQQTDLTRYLGDITQEELLSSVIN